MKITAFDVLYPSMLAGVGASLDYSSGSNTAEGDVSGGGDVTGSPGDYTVVGLRSQVSLASNMGDSTVGSVLTTIQTSPWLAAFALSSNSGVSFGSNATRVSETSSVGALATAAREDHIHDGIGTITASSSNTMQRGTFNLRPGSNVTFGLSDADGDGEFDTLTLNGAAAAGGGAQAVAIVAVVDGGGSAITTGVKVDLQVPFACTITGWSVLLDQSGSIVFDVWKDTEANYPPTVADTITASDKPTVSTATKASGTSLTGWTTSIAAGDTLRVNVDSITTAERATLTLTASRA